jgi:hypothetical protein
MGGAYRVRDVHVFIGLAALLVVAAGLYALWWFIPPPGGLDEPRVRAIAQREAPGGQVSEVKLGHCDQLLQEAFPRATPACGGQWVWMVTIANACQGGRFSAPPLFILDYRSGEVTQKQACGLG